MFPIGAKVEVVGSSHYGIGTVIAVHNTGDDPLYDVLIESVTFRRIALTFRGTQLRCYNGHNKSEDQDFY